MSSNIRRRESVSLSPVETAKKPGIGERLTRNTAIAVLLLLTVIGLRESSSGSFLRAIQTAVENEWDQNVGRLTYVGNTVADTIQVFAFGSADPELTAPVFAEAVQGDSADTPYTVYERAGCVYAAASGEVSQVAHDDEERYIVHIIHNNGLNTVYYGLESCYVAEGDPVTESTLLGFSESELAFEARKNGKSVNLEGRLARREK